MMEIGGLQITETWVEYAVEPFEGTLLDCDTLAEAQDIAQKWGTPVLARHCYMTGWEPA